jgi:hypothetical protein
MHVSVITHCCAVNKRVAGEEFGITMPGRSDDLQTTTLPPAPDGSIAPKP